jgi:NDP-sugar pyrophosphorylase family protein
LSSPSLIPVAILAGGLATRMRPVTERIPKALVPVAGRPFIARQLRYLRAQGVSRVVICTGYLGELIEEAIGDGSAFGLEVTYSPDGPVLLGTGGALRQALPALGDAFFVLYGDSYLPCDFLHVQRAFERAGSPALMTVFRNDGRWDTSNVLFRDGRVVRYDKLAPGPEMHYIDYGLGVLSARVVGAYPAGRVLDLAEMYHRLAADGQLAGFEIAERFYEIGSPAGLKDAEAYFATEERA